MKQQIAFLLICLMIVIDIQAIEWMWLYAVPLGVACLLLWYDHSFTNYQNTKERMRNHSNIRTF